MGQVFDSGLLGEGVLHMLAWTRARLAAPGATLVRIATALAPFLRPPQAHMQTRVDAKCLCAWSLPQSGSQAHAAAERVQRRCPWAQSCSASP